MILDIQIRSFIKGGNHGQYLQALGLQHEIRKIVPDAKVSHLDYSNHGKFEIKVQTKSGLLPKYLAMRYFWSKNIRFTSIDENPDICVFGSDQIWHLDSSLFPPDPVYFGSSCNASKIAYAPSVGFRTKVEPGWIKAHLDEFEWIGARDRNTAEFAADHTHRSWPCVIDPCFFLLGSKYLLNTSGKDRQNVLSVYSPIPEGKVNLLRNGIGTRLFQELFPKIDYTGYYPRRRFVFELRKQFQNPLQVIHAIANSKLLLTSTFHGTMMALMTRTPFIAIRSPNLDARLNSPISEAFSPARLIDVEQFRELGHQDIKNYIQDDDMNNEVLQDYILESKKILSQRILQVIKQCKTNRA